MSLEVPDEDLDFDKQAHPPRYIPNLGLQYLSYVCVYCCGFKKQ